MQELEVAADNGMKEEIQERLVRVEEDVQFWIELVNKKESATIHYEINGEPKTQLGYNDLLL